MKRRRRPKARRACDVVSCLRADPAPTPTAGASAQSKKAVRVTTRSFAASTTGCSGEAPAGQKTTRAFGGARAGGIAAADRSTSRPRLQHERETVRRPTSHERAVRVLAAPSGRARVACIFRLTARVRLLAPSAPVSGLAPAQIPPKGRLGPLREDKSGFCQKSTYTIQPIRVDANTQ